MTTAALEGGDAIDEIEDAIRYFIGHGWTREQAEGLFDSFKLTGGTPNWKPEHLQKLHDWSSAHERDANTIEGQLDYIAYQLRNSYEGIGRALDQAQTVEAAKHAVELFVKLLSAGIRNETGVKT